MNPPRVVFAGTPEFARASLQALVQAGTVPVAVLTQPDRPAGRGKKLTASPVKEYALERHIDVLQPASLRSSDSQAAIAVLDADILIVAAYGLLLPQAILDLPRQGCLNVHASLLPRWRGAAPIQAAILADDKETGISLMAMTAGLDCGPVYATRAIAIGASETAGELHDRLAVLGGELLVEQLDAIATGELAPRAQDDQLATYAGKIQTAHAQLDWAASADELLRKVRAYNPVPGAWFMCGTERIKCWAASPAKPGADRGAPGSITIGEQVQVACGGGALQLDVLQRPGKQRLAAREVMRQLGFDGRDPAQL
jgi:methionyl-tRNA formyltransferase